jgi:hypothetical protein
MPIPDQHAAMTANEYITAFSKSIMPYIYSPVALSQKSTETVNRKDSCYGVQIS